MLAEFFQLGPIPSNAMVGWYDAKLVILSYVVATLASYIALDITGRLRDVTNTPLSRILWLFGGAIAMGAGIWSMHFIGMLAFKLPMPMMYSAGWTALSMVVAIAASGFAFFLLKAPIVTSIHILIGGIILGCAIAAMHYTGMHAMTINMNIHYLPGLFALSILIAVIASQAALWLALKSTQVVSRFRFRLKFVSAFIMGAAICGMHYTGMFAAVFTPQGNMENMASAIDPEFLAISIAGVTLLILSIAFLASTYKESLNQQLLLTARQAGMAEVAASVLHNVGNILNSINVSSLLISEKLNQSELSALKDLNQLVQTHRDDLDTFIKNDDRGKHFPQFINSLSEYWQNEQTMLTNEIQAIVKNIDHVKNIIATQQDLSRVSEFKQVISIENVVEEAILISGIENQKYGLIVKRDFDPIKPVMVDKVKLLQILVNLIQNAKDSLIESAAQPKVIELKIKIKDSFFEIIISDNGLGIARENLLRIFTYGFTTKQTGHGFGLHTSAIFAKEMDGVLKADSPGKDKGATFTLELPYIPT